MNNIEKIENHLKNHLTITTIEAFTLYQICHLAKYIQLLKTKMEIRSVWLKSSTSGKNYKLYYILREAMK